jgi:hypothetical protein
MPFTWPVSLGGYRWAGPPDARILTPREPDGARREYSPLQDHTGLFLTFAATDTTEAGVLAFAARYGVLGVGTLRGWEVEPDGRLSAWVGQIRAMRECTGRWAGLVKRRSNERTKGRLYDAVNGHLLRSYWAGVFGLDSPDDRPRRVLELDVEKLTALPPPPLIQLLGAATEGKVTLEARPANLLNALWHQLASAIAQDTEFRQCPSCGSWFAVSPERRRADAQYCREACRVRAYKRRKKEARRLHAAGSPLKQIAKELGTSVKVVRGWLLGPEG